MSEPGLLEICPECAFTFAADHVDVDDPIYHCPACAEIR